MQQPWLKKEIYPQEKKDTLHHYRTLLQAPYFFILQHNHLSAEEWTPIRSALQKVGLGLTCVKGSLFRVLLKESPEWAKLMEASMAGGIAVVRPFVPMPLAVDPNATAKAAPPTKEVEALFQATAGEAPSKIKRMMTILKKTGGDKLVLVGGCVENSAMGPNMVSKVGAMPPRSALQAQLLGLLQQPASMLAATLAHHPQMLSLTLQQHRDNLAK